MVQQLINRQTDAHLMALCLGLPG